MGDKRDDNPKHDTLNIYLFQRITNKTVFHNSVNSQTSVLTFLEDLLPRCFSFLWQKTSVKVVLDIKEAFNKAKACKERQKFDQIPTICWLL